MKIRKNDKVKVIAGKDLGKEGTVLRVFASKNQVLVEGVNMAKRHVKPGKVNKEGGILDMERPMDVSNVLVICDKCNTPTRIGSKTEKNKKFRVCKKCGEVLGK